MSPGRTKKTALTLVRGQTTKRKLKRNEKINPDRQKSLEEIGIEWVLREKRANLWMFQEKRMSSSCEISPIVPPKRDYDTGTILGRITPTREELKDHSEHSSLPPPCQKIRFNPSAYVVYIPNRNQCSNRGIKKCIWTDRYELGEIVERNTLEFEYEGYDFNKVVED